MKIKTKLNAGVGLLFFMIIVLSTLGGWFIYQLKKDTQNILTDNYNTLQYSRNMLLSLEEIGKEPFAIADFQKNLDLQRQNITEDGEKAATKNILAHFSDLKNNEGNLSLHSAIRKDIAELMQLNMNAIQIKSGIANTTAQNAIAVISIAGTLCFLIAFILMVNLPANISNPIRELTSSIHQIANQNYRERVQFESNSEFGELARSFNTMAEKLQEYSESRIDKILKGKKRIETLIDNMHDAVIGIDENRNVLFVNDEALKISGLKKENFVGKLIQDVAVSNDLVRDLIKEIIDPDAEKNPAELLKIFVEGKENYFEKEILDINVIPTGENDSRFIGQVIMLRNITPFKELDLAKTRFIGTVSHEFKTPISSIQMGLQLLENEKIGSLNEEQQKLIKGIDEDTLRLLKITGELLNIAQLETGVSQLDIRPFKIDTMLEEVIKTNKSAADRRQISIITDIGSGLDIINADQEKTLWVLNNIVSNAIRYSYEQSTVTIKIEKLDSDHVKFSVEDQGLGIDEQYLKHIFTRYFRVPGTKAEGTGLGLSISKEFIEAQRGSIAVESEVGKGSVFSFILKN
ncbi:HAMP domain-containing sensor histidine kinase [Chryseobacterium balustinum]|uniref:histidine kinase n=1 Tax=Chryseobacterium balustinum TaxID=246 RepID=A0AAX2ILS1_9FLAO|nr:ATP-binding protein [Chryseobacterium balustinum]AZB29425.1 HAMP domain-containing protein [Chryseobacterium balustinum]SKB75461.1 PAS/PAC sensor signal transduction histidine kinase [Chryseobacterium balustinum]SQA90721.1 Alginate biosynthesis sensor protein kinB [Chryseobacterium balustinum]